MANCAQNPEDGIFKEELEYAEHFNAQSRIVREVQDVRLNRVNRRYLYFGKDGTMSAKVRGSLWCS